LVSVYHQYINVQPSDGGNVLIKAQLT